jgi:hypothetical protein
MASAAALWRTIRPWLASAITTPLGICPITASRNPRSRSAASCAASSRARARRLSSARSRSLTSLKIQRSALISPLSSCTAVTVHDTSTGSAVRRGRRRTSQSSTRPNCTAWERRARKSPRASGTTNTPSGFPAMRGGGTFSSAEAAKLASRMAPSGVVTR